MASLFETETCGRCGGSGHYSYNQMDGTTCFGCNGTKVRLTKRGSAAQAWYRRQTTVPFSQIKVGDLVWAENFFSGYAAWFRVDEIDGDNVELSYQRKGRPERDHMTFSGYTEFRVRPSTKFGVRWQQMVALAYQANLTKAGTVRAASC
jgi:hypothetical protein